MGEVPANGGRGPLDEERLRTFYRIVLTDPPTIADFRSYAAGARSAPPDNPEALRLWDGLSMYERESQARRKGKGFPWRGRGYIAEVRLPQDATVRVERTGHSAGHYTLWGEAQGLLDCVVRVVPISAGGGRP